uniref:hypothetical protein n=1 Tax=Marinobacterium profundum TaxID=1714300 RepID=UPI000AF47410|nr:hypothetical protein [Marinobacterium profundum]
MAMLSLALKNLRNRAGSAALTVLTIAISVMLFLADGVEHGTAVLLLDCYLCWPEAV